ncbi:hypothetical protein ACRU1U_07145 [Providencia stuartii]|uniref:tail fiber/spike domain-containing protein n=1 Tax=Providencia stuartii TaxID=588 RepID=UPI003D7F6579
MTIYKTGNPLGSTSPKDVNDNSIIFDNYINSNETITQDRFGNTRYTIEGLNHLAKQAMSNYGYVTKKSFEMGNTLTAANDVLLFESEGEYYRWGGNFPKDVPAGSTPESAGGIGTDKWTSVGDASLRSDLKQEAGAQLIGTDDGETVQRSINILKKIHANPKDYGVTYGVMDSEQAKVDNSGYLQECIADADHILVHSRIEIKKGVRLRNGLTIRGFNRNRSAIVGFDETEPTLYDKTTANANNQNNNLWQCKIDSIAIRSMLSNAMHITPYQCEFTNLGMSSPHGACIKIHDGGYQVENEISNNYFSSYKYGVQAAGGFRNFTDNYLTDNYFWSNQVANSAIHCAVSSGSVYRGNHFYGGNHVDSMMHLVGGSNISVTENYFEGDVNARLWIDMGNPSSFIISNNKFWRGDGNIADSIGDISALIKISFNAHNPSQATFGTNIFEGGVNNVPVFSLLNGNISNLYNSKVIFDNSNVLNGDYSLVTLARSGDAQYSGVIQVHQSQFIKFVSEQNGNFYSDACSEFVALDTGSEVSYPVLPTNPNWIKTREIIITNAAKSTELRFSSGAPISGYNHIKPRERVRVIYDVGAKGYLFLPL